MLGNSQLINPNIFWTIFFLITSVPGCLYLLEKVYLFLENKLTLYEKALATFQCL